MEIPFNLLILPFLGGYIFVRFFNYFRIHTLRSDKERIVIRSSVAGLAALTAAWAFSLIGAWILPCENFSFCIPTIWGQLVPFEHSGIAVTAFIIASMSWYPLNKWKGSRLWPLNHIPSFDREDQINRAISDDADPLEMMLKRSKDEGCALALTMTNEKVYIGRVVHPFNPATPTTYVGLLPLQSGYRDPETKQMHLRIDYSLTMKSITEELDEIAVKIKNLETKQTEYKNASLPAKVRSLDEPLSKARDSFDELKRIIGLFSLVIPVGKIASAHVFDSGVHAKYFQPTKASKR